MAVKAETLTVQFGTKLPQRTQKSFERGKSFLFFDTFKKNLWKLLFFFPLATSSILNSKTCCVSKWQTKQDKQSQVKIYLWYLRKCCDFVCFLEGTFEVICSAQGLLNAPADSPAESWKRGNLSSEEKIAFFYVFALGFLIGNYRVRVSGHICWHSNILMHCV